MQPQSTSYACDDREFGGFLVAPDGAGPGERPGVLLLHGGGGLREHERENARRLAAFGYVVFAPDLIGEAPVDPSRGRAVIQELVARPSVLRARVEAAWRHLLEHAAVDARRTAAVGHCFGGLVALELARSGAPIGAAVSFHGGLGARQPARRGDVRARVLACTGAEDPFCSREQRAAFEEEMTDAGVDWQLHVYAAAKHGFTIRDADPAKHPGCEYHAASDRRSWRAMLELLTEAFEAATA